MLTRKFHICIDEAKTTLCRAFCTPLHTAQLRCDHSKATMNKVKVAYNDALRILESSYATQSGKVVARCL